MGTGGGWGLLPAGDAVFLPAGEGAGEDCCAEESRFVEVPFADGSGGGYGEMDTAEMDAECAW